MKFSETKLVTLLKLFVSPSIFSLFPIISNFQHDNVIFQLFWPRRAWSSLGQFPGWVPWHFFRKPLLENWKIILELPAQIPGGFLIDSLLNVYGKSFCGSLGQFPDIASLNLYQLTMENAPRATWIKSSIYFFIRSTLKAESSFKVNGKCSGRFRCRFPMGVFRNWNICET